MVTSEYHTQKPRLVLSDRLQGGHDDCVWESRWSLNGNLLATCGADKSVCIWKKPNSPNEKWQAVQKLSGVHTRTVRAVAWSPCGRMLATASFDATVVIWRLDKQSGEFEQVSFVEGHESEVKSLTWSCNGELLASCSRDRTIWLWGPENDEDEDSSYECFDMISNAHSQDIKCVAFHPDDPNLLASCSYDETVCIYRGDHDGQWETVQTLTGHTSTVWAVAFDPSGKTNRLASCSADGCLRMWKQSPLEKQFSFEAVLRVNSEPQNTGTEVKFESETWTPEPSPIYDLSWSSNGMLLASISGGCDRILRIHGIRRPENSADGVFVSGPLFVRKLGSDPNSVQFMPSQNEDELVLAVTTESSEILIFNIEGVDWGELF